MSTKPRNFTQALDELEQYASSKAREKFEELKPHFEDLKNRAGDEAQKAKHKVEAQVKDNPWAAIGIVSLIFFVLGFLLAGRSRRDD